MTGTNNTRTTLFSKQKQQRRNQLFKVVGFILYSLGLVSLVLILLMAQRLESGKNRSYRVLLDFVSIDRRNLLCFCYFLFQPSIIFQSRKAN